MSQRQLRRCCCSPCCLHLSSRPERIENLSFQEILSAERRDPEAVSSTMPLQGVLPRLPIATAPTRKDDPPRVRGIRFGSCHATYCPTLELNWDKPWEELPVAAWSRMVHWDPSAPRHGSAVRLRTQRRSGRDDSLNRFRQGWYVQDQTLDYVISRGALTLRPVAGHYLPPLLPCTQCAVRVLASLMLTWTMHERSTAA